SLPRREERAGERRAIFIGLPLYPLPCRAKTELTASCHVLQSLLNSMAAVSETIVREYFELHGFFVRQQRKYIAPARREDDEVDFFVLNPLFVGIPASAL